MSLIGEVRIGRRGGGSRTFKALLLRDALVQALGFRVRAENGGWITGAIVVASICNIMNPPQTINS